MQHPVDERRCCVDVTLQRVDGVLKLTLHNSSKLPVAWKVKTNRKHKFLFRPTQGTIPPQEDTHCKVFENKRKDARDKDPAPIDLPGKPAKFLIQSVSVGADECLTTDELTEMWHQKQIIHDPKRGKPQFFETILHYDAATDTVTTRAPSSSSHHSRSRGSTSSIVSATGGSGSGNYSSLLAVPTRAPTKSSGSRHSTGPDQRRNSISKSCVSVMAAPPDDDDDDEQPERENPAAPKQSDNTKSGNGDLSNVVLNLLAAKNGNEATKHKKEEEAAQKPKRKLSIAGFTFRRRPKAEKVSSQPNTFPRSLARPAANTDTSSNKKNAETATRSRTEFADDDEGGKNGKGGRGAGGGGDMSLIEALGFDFGPELDNSKKKKQHTGDVDHDKDKDREEAESQLDDVHSRLRVPSVDMTKVGDDDEHEKDIEGDRKEVTSAPSGQSNESDESANTSGVVVSKLENHDDSDADADADDNTEIVVIEPQAAELSGTDDDDGDDDDGDEDGEIQLLAAATPSFTPPPKMAQTKTCDEGPQPSAAATDGEQPPPPQEPSKEPSQELSADPNSKSSAEAALPLVLSHEEGAEDKAQRQRTSKILVSPRARFSDTRFDALVAKANADEPPVVALHRVRSMPAVVGPGDQQYKLLLDYVTKISKENKDYRVALSLVEERNTRLQTELDFLMARARESKLDNKTVAKRLSALFATSEEDTLQFSRRVGRRASLQAGTAFMQFGEALHQFSGDWKEAPRQHESLEAMRAAGLALVRAAGVPEQHARPTLAALCFAMLVAVLLFVWRSIVG